MSAAQMYGTGPVAPSEVTGKYIAVLCDADMTATTFSDGLLGTRPAGAKDAMTVVKLPIAMPDSREASTWQTHVAQVDVSNSTMGPPTSLAVTPDGRFAYAVETRGPAGPTATKLDDLPGGQLLTAVDLTDPAAPSVLGTINVGGGPRAVDVRADGRYVAVASGTPGGQLVIVKVSPTAPLTEPMSFKLPGIGDRNVKPSSVQWHPSGRYLALTLPESNEVAFFEFNPDVGNGNPGIAPWGEPVKVGKYPASGRFSPCGRYFITTDLGWGTDVPGFMAGAPEGQLSVIALSDVASSIDEHGTLDVSRVRHGVTARAGVGISPEALAISPDGRFVVTGNVKTSFMPVGDARHSAGSLSLLSFEPGSGQLTNLGEFPIAAMPQGVAFDASGQNVIVSQFRSFDPGAVDGELAFFKLLRDPAPRLEQADFFVGVGVGPHGVLIVR
jgi:DNA-binding beta-propeller fold protein YncE